MFIARIDHAREHHNKGTTNDTIHVTYTVAQCSDNEKLEGRQFVMIFMASGKGQDMGLARFQDVMMSAAGFTDADAFHEYNGEEGEFLQACLGYSNERSNDDLLCDGRLVHVSVSRGGETKNGDYYREYAFTAIDQETGEPIATEE